jgi:hypothetical protein
MREQQTTGWRFAVQRMVDRLTGGRVDAQMPSGKPNHGARRYNRMAARGTVFISGMSRRMKP